MAHETTVVHVTHETVGKIGGIGAVLQGLSTSKSYLQAIQRSIIVGPLFTTEGSVLDRLGEDGEVLYSSVDGFVDGGYAPAFRKIESLYNVGIVYGRRTFVDEETGIKSSPEVVLVDIARMDKRILNEFKRRLFEEFGVQSHLYEHLWEYEQYVRLGPPAIEVLKAIGAAKDSTVILAHEFMGMPTALAGILEPECNFKTAFYAHEVATMRRIVEEHPGHDTMFYNVMKQAHKEKIYVNEVFGDQNSYFKTGLVEASKYCDHLFAVGDYVVEELRFLATEFETVGIDIVYVDRPDTRSLHGQRHAAGHANALGIRRRDMDRIRGRSIAYQLSQRLGLAGQRVFKIFEDKEGAALGHDKPVPARIKRPAGPSRIMISPRQSPHAIKRGQGNGRNGSLKTTGEHRPGVASPDRLEGLADSIGARRTR